MRNSRPPPSEPVGAAGRGKVTHLPSLPTSPARLAPRAHAADPGPHTFSCTRLMLLPRSKRIQYKSAGAVAFGSFGVGGTRRRTRLAAELYSSLLSQYSTTYPEDCFPLRQSGRQTTTVARAYVSPWPPRPCDSSQLRLAHAEPSISVGGPDRSRGLCRVAALGETGHSHQGARLPYSKSGKQQYCTASFNKT